MNTSSWARITITRVSRRPPSTTIRFER
jgi:hypothetical protein